MVKTNNKISFQELARRGFPIASANEAIPKSWFTKKTIALEEVHKGLAHIKGNLAEEIRKMRRENN